MSWVSNAPSCLVLVHCIAVGPPGRLTRGAPLLAKRGPVVLEGVEWRAASGPWRGVRPTQSSKAPRTGPRPPPVLRRTLESDVGIALKHPSICIQPPLFNSPTPNHSKHKALSGRNSVPCQAGPGSEVIIRTTWCNWLDWRRPLIPDRFVPPESLGQAADCLVAWPGGLHPQTAESTATCRASN